MDNLKASVTVIDDEEWLMVRRPCGGIASRRTQWHLQGNTAPRGIEPAILRATGGHTAPIPPIGGGNNTMKLGCDYKIIDL